ncbi:MAG: hypothetical protein ACLT8E_08865 [Akkermansia sp.]
MHRLDWAQALKSESCLSSRPVPGRTAVSLLAVFYLPLALINPAVCCFSVSKVE